VCGTVNGDGSLDTQVAFGSTWPTTKVQLRSHHCVLDGASTTPYVDGVAANGATRSSAWEGGLAYADVEVGSKVTAVRLLAVQVFYAAKSAASTTRTTRCQRHTRTDPKAL
jgi:hypothetical protein